MWRTQHRQEARADDSRSRASRDAGSSPAPRRTIWGLLILTLISLNLRPSLTSVPALVDALRSDLHLSAGFLALLTALPLLVFGLLSTSVPGIARALTPERTLACALGLLTVTLSLRVIGGPTTLLIGTALAATAITVTNVLIPGLIRRDHSDRAGLATGLYAMALGMGASAGAATAVPLQDLFGGRWQPALAAWALPALLALAGWQLVTRAGRRSSAVDVRPHTDGRMLRQPIAWAVLLFLGLQSLIFFTLIAWLPAFFQDLGYSPGRAGFLLALAQLAGIPGGLIVPQLAMRSRHQVGYVVATTLLNVVGLLGLVLAPTAAPDLWAVSVGVGSTAFPLGLTLIVLRTRVPTATDALSGFAQGGAYLIAALGPLLAGTLHDATSSWRVPMVVLLLLCLPQLVAGMSAGRARLIA
ncbi:MFS transporter [Geodermatophilus sp. URMC 64]